MNAAKTAFANWLCPEKEYNAMTEKLKAKSWLSKIGVKSATVTIQISDFEGNKTLYTGMNDAQSIDSLIQFLNERKRHLMNSDDDPFEATRNRIIEEFDGIISYLKSIEEEGDNSTDADDMKCIRDFYKDKKYTDAYRVAKYVDTYIREMIPTDAFNFIKQFND